MDETKWYLTLSYQKTKDIIREKLQNMSRDFIAVGYFLKFIRDRESYQEEGYENIWEFAEDNYGIKRSTASRWMSMNDKFSKEGNTPILAEEYRDFGKSQLQEMLYLDDEQMEEVGPGMTVKEIRELRNPEVTLDPKTLSAYGLPKTVRAEDSLINTPGCGDGKHDCFMCHKECEIRQDDRRCRVSTCGNPKPCTQIGDDSLTHSIYADLCMFVHPELAPIRPGDGEPDPCCLSCSVKECSLLACDVMKKRKEEDKTATAVETEVFEQEDDDELLCDDCANASTLTGNIDLCSTCESDDRNYKPLNEQEECATSHTEEQISGQMDIENAFPEYLPDPIESTEDDLPEDIIDVEEMVEEDGELYEEITEELDIDLLKQMRDREEIMLKNMQKCYSDNDFRVRKQKLLVGALAGMLCDLDEFEVMEQPELPVMKNNEQRKEWLRNYTDWGLWYEDKNIGCRYFKYDFENGARLIAEVYTSNENDWKWVSSFETSYLHLVGGPEPTRNKSAPGIPKWTFHKKYSRYPNSETELVEFLKFVQKGEK